MTWSNRREVRIKTIGIVVVVLVTLATYWLTGSDTEDAADTGAPTGTSGSVQSPEAPGDVDPISGLDYVEVGDLPDEAVRMLAVIEDGGPYAYSQDDSTFQNREGILPQEPMGYYREYTVETPGSPDRGARRIVAGADGERYYTDDHYDSFRVVRE